jgi:predicted transcriptional regulator
MDTLCMENVNVYECEVCEQFLLVPEESSRTECCGEGLRRIRPEDAKTQVEKPRTVDSLKKIYDLTETSLDICFCVMEKGEATVSDVADETEIDRSAVSRHMNSLFEAGILSRKERNLKQGGVVHVYEHEEPETVKRRITLGSYFWTASVIELMNDLGDDKMAAIVDDVDVSEAVGGDVWKD